MNNIKGMACITLLLFFWPVFADMQEVEIKAVEISDSIYMLQGRGGNIGLSRGDDGVLMIDDQFAPLSDKISDKIKTLSDQAVKFVINTHWHGDHTGGNQNFADSGSAIVAHENVRVRMSSDQKISGLGRDVKAAPISALPVITYKRNMTFYFNGDEIDVVHIPRGHTDGDSLIHFKNDNVIHAGDLFFNGSYPFIDTSSGGSFDGVIAAAETIIALCDEHTKIIPGHGPLATVDDLIAYRDMLMTIRKTLIEYLNEGMSLSAVEIRDPLKPYNEKWGNGFMKPHVWLRIIYQDLAQQ